MAFPIGALVLDFCVLAVVEKEDTYGYELNQVLMNTLSLSESTLYPVLRRLKKNHFLTTYDKAFDGRNRRYYSITEEGRKELKHYRKDWKIYKDLIDEVVGGGEND